MNLSLAALLLLLAAPGRAEYVTNHTFDNGVSLWENADAGNYRLMDARGTPILTLAISRPVRWIAKTGRYFALGHGPKERLRMSVVSSGGRTLAVDLEVATPEAFSLHADDERIVLAGPKETVVLSREGAVLCHEKGKRKPCAKDPLVKKLRQGRASPSF